MKNPGWLRRLMAWTLAAILLLGAPCRAEALPYENEPDEFAVIAEPAEAEVAELGTFDLCDSSGLGWELSSGLLPPEGEILAPEPGTDEAYVGEETPVDDIPAEDATPIGDDLPVGDAAPIEDDIPAGDEAPMEGGAPGEDTDPAGRIAAAGGAAQDDGAEDESAGGAVTADGVDGSENEADADGGENADDAGTGDGAESADDAGAAEGILAAPEPAAPVPPLALSVTALKLGLKEKYTLRATLSLPEGEEVPPVRFSSSKKSVVTVNAATGQLTAKKKGRAVVTAVAGSYRAACTVQVLKAPKKVQFTAKSVTLGEGETRRLGTKLTAKAASRLRFSSSNAAVAVIDGSGVVTAVGRGTATLTVRTFNNKKATCKVVVKAAPTSVTLTPGTLTLGVGQAAAVRPAVNAGAAGAVRIQSDDAALVSAGGTTVKGLAVGETTVTGTAYNGAQGFMTVRVLPAPERVSFTSGTITIGKGEKVALKPVIDEGSHTAFSYKSKKSSIASVSGSGVVKGKRTGKTTVTVTTHNGRKAAITVKVAKAPKKVKLSPAKLTLPLGGSRVLKAKLSGGASRLSWSSSRPDVVSVNGSGVVTAMSRGSAVVTARTFNGKKATCTVAVGEPDAPPAAPIGVAVSALNTASAAVTWTGNSAAQGYRVYVGGQPMDAELYGDYGASAARAVLRGLRPGQTVYVCVTAWNARGETAMGDWIALEMPDRTTSGGGGSGETGGDSGGTGGETVGEAPEIALNYTGVILLKAGSRRELVATMTPAGDGDRIAWETTSAAIAPITAGGSRCVVAAERPGVATVSAELPEGASAAVTVMVVDTNDVTRANLSRVQSAVARHEALMDEDAGDNVIWNLIRGALVKAGVGEARAADTVSRISSAGSAFRDLYVYSFGSYAIVGDAETDGDGSPVSTSYFYPEYNTTYLQVSNLSNKGYAYELFHETGHAIDFNAGGNGELSSLNDDAYQAIMSDVRSLLTERVGAAAAGAGVDAGTIDTVRVVEAVLDYRELKQHDVVMATMTAAEQAVYQQLVDDMTAEINATLPKNNGIMVWDALEGATNFAVSGDYGHSYMFDIPAYRQLAFNYFYDDDGSATISTEPWAEFYAAGAMNDSATMSINETYLPQTVRYFAETLLPTALDWFKNKVLGR